MERSKYSFNKTRTLVAAGALYLRALTLINTGEAYALQEVECHGAMVNATYYNLHGRPTASGEIMDRNARTAAIPISRYRRFGEELGDSARITYMETGTSVVVRLNDTGLMGSGSYSHLYVDVTEGVAEEMGWKDLGVVPVCYEVLRENQE